MQQTGFLFSWSDGLLQQLLRSCWFSGCPASWICVLKSAASNQYYCNRRLSLPQPSLFPAAVSRHRLTGLCCKNSVITCWPWCKSSQSKLPSSICTGKISCVNRGSRRWRACTLSVQVQVLTRKDPERTKLASLQLLPPLSHFSFPPFSSLPVLLSSWRGCHCIVVLRDESKWLLMGDMIVL